MADGNITVEVSVQSALNADVFEALDLSPEQFLTGGGLINRGKLRAAFWYPHEYLPEGHWMRAADSQAPMAEALRDLLAAHAMRASCQAGLVERCKCVPCATARAREALGPN